MVQIKDITTGAARRKTWRRLLDNWLRRRAPIHVPLTLAYRNIFILPTRFGWMLGLLMGAMLAGSLNFNNNLGLLTTFIVAGLGVNSMLLAFHNLHGIAIRHGIAAPVFAGQTARFHLTVATPEPRKRPSLCIRQDNREQSFSIEPASATEVVLALPVMRRGWHKPGRMQITTTHPIGLFRAWSWFWPVQPVLVWPRPAQHAPPLPEGSGDDQGRELRPEPEGEEFHSLRTWREGDPVHRIAWKASQRHQTLLSREFRREQSPHLTFDLAATPGRDLEERISVLTAWVLQAEQENRQWSLKLDQHTIAPGRGQAHRDQCLRALAEL